MMFGILTKSITAREMLTVESSVLENDVCLTLFFIMKH